MRSSTVRSLRVVVAALVVAVGLAGCGEDSVREFVGYTLEPAPAVGDLALPDAASDGAVVPLRAEEGGVLLVYFGYTHCPDVCPMTMSDLSVVLADVEDSERVEVAMVTVDPDRDTDDVLTGYVRSFVPDGRALRASDADELRDVADRFGASYSVTERDGGVEVAHSGSVYVVDEIGTVRLVWTFGTLADDMSGDVELLLDSIAS